MGKRNVVGIAEARRALDAGGKIVINRGIQTSAALLRGDGSYCTLLYPAFSNLINNGEIEKLPPPNDSLLEYYARRAKP